MKTLLKDYTIIDWSSHLPGPYACHILSEMGAKVIKITPDNKPMPFQRFEKDGPQKIFHYWFQEFNQNKQTSSFSDEILKNANGIITNQTYDFPDNLVVTKIIASSKDSTPRHDLNVLAESGFLSRYIKTLNSTTNSLSPPSLPWAGIALAQSIAQTHLAQLLADDKYQEVSLKESFERLMKTFFDSNDEQSLYLHNGAYPCYRLYKMASGQWVALAAIEAKYWKQFCQFFNLNLKETDRFSTDSSVVESIEKHFLSIDSIDELQTRDFCLSLVIS